MTTTNTEKRIAKMARSTAKIICQLRREGETAAAIRLQAAAIETAELMRAGQL